MANEMNYTILNKLMLDRAYEATKNTDRIQRYDDDHLITELYRFDTVLERVVETMNTNEFQRIDPDDDNHYAEHHYRTPVAHPRKTDNVAEGGLLNLLFVTLKEDGKKKKELRLVDNTNFPYGRVDVPLGRLSTKKIEPLVRGLYGKVGEYIDKYNTHADAGRRKYLLKEAYDFHYLEPLRMLSVPHRHILPEHTVYEMMGMMKDKNWGEVPMRVVEEKLAEKYAYLDKRIQHKAPNGV